jgi:UDPglucose 6-dehydrogenase
MGYGGYCFPKDTKQLLANFAEVPQTIIGAIVESNIVRKQAIVDVISSQEPETIGVYRLAMKAGSDNFRDAAIIDIMRQLRAKGHDIVIYEPTVNAFEDYAVDNDLERFVDKADIILANRVDDEKRVLFGKKLFTRDVFGTD